METTQTTAIETLAYLAREIPRYGGDLSSWAYSPESLDRGAAQEMRSRASALSEAVYADPMASAVAACVLAWICRSDAYAAKEIAGRFSAACARRRLVAKIRTRRDWPRFSSLLSAIERGRFSQAQINLARKLAAEVA